MSPDFDEEDEELIADIENFEDLTGRDVRMRRLLLDTHAFLWWVSEVDRLTAGARAAIADPRNEVFVSAVTGWEIAVKRARAN